MPTTPADRILNAGIAIAELFRAGEMDIISLLALFCGKGKKKQEQSLKRLRQKKTRSRFSAALNRVLQELQQKAYQEAMRRLTDMYQATAAEVEALSEYIEGDLTRTAQSAQSAVQDLLDDLNTQWLEGLKNMRRKADDVYRHVIELEQANADAAGDDLRKAVEEALQTFAEKGVTGFTDRANRNWGLAEYSEMAMRTAMQRANLLSTIDAMLRSGQDLCYVNRHMGSCPMCMHWEGVLISLTGRTPGYITLQQAMAGGLFHPNCAHILLVYIQGVSRLDIGRPKDISDLENRKLYLKRQQQRYLERNVRKWKKKQAAATSPEYERYCMHQVEYWQGRIRKHIKDNPELPRRYDREGGKVVLSELAKAKAEGGGAPKAPRDATWKRLITTPEQAAEIGKKTQ